MFWDPWNEIVRMHKEMDRLFSGIYEKPGNFLEDRKNFRELSELGRTRAPVADVRETETGFLANIELPGAEKKDIKLNLTDNSIEVSIDRKDEKSIERDGIKGYSSRFSRFYRKIPLPVDIDTGKAKASYKDGMLRLEIPKVLKESRKRIDIE